MDKWLNIISNVWIMVSLYSTGFMTDRFAKMNNKRKIRNKKKSLIKMIRLIKKIVKTLDKLIIIARNR